MQGFSKICNTIEKACQFVAVGIFAAITVVYFGSVAMRYLLGKGFHGSEELTRYGTIWLIYLSAVVMTKHSEHINVSVMENILKGRARKILLLVQRLLMGVYIGILFFVSIGMVRVGTLQTSPNMNIPMSIVYMIFPVSFLLMIVNIVFLVLQDIAGLRRADGEDELC